MIEGDNWVGKVVGAVMRNRREWNSTAIFLAWDDCGCFYDQVRPPLGQGIRLPMIMISPWAKPLFVDHTKATLASMLAFTEHVYGLPPLPGGEDATAYDYLQSFDFSQQPQPPIANRPMRPDGHLAAAAQGAQHTAFGVYGRMGSRMIQPGAGIEGCA